MTQPSRDERIEQSRRYWDKHASAYDKSMALLDRTVFGPSRDWVCSQALGRTLEVGVGTGLNLSRYPADVRLTAIDLSPEMLAVARKRAAALGRDVRLEEADAQRLPFEDGSFDTVTSTLALCAVPDERLVVAEMYRVLKPGGRLVLLDHVRPSSPPLRWLFRGLQAMVNRFSPDSGEHFLRRPIETVVAQGFTVEHSERFKGGVIERVTARKVR
ncbi:ubiquinone/menaquinone biosynthesis C-methylase UbiE [Kibdelosporangium banguiense]|uniref:Ubiquinone/menaquinone biosynthesis C-methylase UbiE n=1 Tax=Kibdelosporangium banguiense TaxID=1365924 RepID=A0ABS4TZ88_9PSEU|nr:class I SAM-dependent methyltransferase [Kibdelosporangium banguiense]MBP2329729.1 ubiquinone/menaquinone biosynthesis C-methylase UbiE [Kibdelosporangium banguiense]